MIERKIIIGLITSTEYCTQIKPIWNDQYIESTTAKLIVRWCWEYFDMYNLAPKRDIENIFYEKLKANKVAKGLAEEIEQEILPSLSTEYETDGINVTYLIDETRKYFATQRIKYLTHIIDASLDIGDLDAAEKMILDYREQQPSVVDLNAYIVNLTQIRERSRTLPTVYLRPWLRAGQTTILYGNYGSGKSLLSILIAYVLGLRRYDTRKSEIGEWCVKNPTGTLYVDGELGEQEMEERISQFEWIGAQQRKLQMRVLSLPEYQLATEDSFYLSNRQNQLRIIKWLQANPTYKLIILDSASTLFGLEDENSNSEWSTKINPFLRDLRALGVANILLHHAGKDNKKGLRGASAMGAMAHNIFRLTNHQSKEIDSGEAWFVLTKDKQRAAGFSFHAFGLHFYQNTSRKETHWEITECIN